MSEEYRIIRIEIGKIALHIDNLRTERKKSS